MERGSPVGLGLDGIARDLAAGAISRRTALRRFGGVAVAALLPGALFADRAAARCPKERRCDGKCCPSHSHCKRGKCKCNRGYTKCARHCRNLKTDPKNCGKCGHVCADGETCVAGVCTPGNPQQVCGNGTREGTEQCDGNDLNGQTCQSLGFVSGSLACLGNCTFDTSNCQAPCQTAADCPPALPGTCQVAICSSGNCGLAADDSNVPDDGNQCTQDLCTGGTPSHQNLAVGTACSQNGGTVCDGNGTCVQCNTVNDCPGSDSECATRTCTSGTCGFTFAPAGTPIAIQTSGDCKQTVCDGNGHTTQQADTNDVPASDNNQCTTEVCVGTVPTHQPTPGVACNQNGGTVCGSSGECVVPTCVGAPNGAPCDDGNACTIGNTCQNGTCTSGVPVTCPAQNSCHAAGVCNPTTGICTNPTQPNGTACNDNNPCTTIDVCIDGICQGTQVANGTPCPTGTCQGGVCTP